MTIEDERAQFYLRHRDQIEEWAALRGEAAVAVDGWLEQLGPDCDALALSLGAQLRVSIGSDQAFPSYRLRDAAWNFADAEEEPACIVLEWARGRTTMRPGLMPYVGLRSSRSHPVGVNLRASDLVRQARAARKDAFASASQWFPAYSYIRPPADFPASTDAYRDLLLDALRMAWTVYAPIVTSVLAAPASADRASDHGVSA